MEGNFTFYFILNSRNSSKYGCTKFDDIYVTCGSFMNVSNNPNQSKYGPAAGWWLLLSAIILSIASLVVSSLSSRLRQIDDVVRKYREIMIHGI